MTLKFTTPARFIFLVALILRLLYLWEQSHTPFFDTTYLDEKYHLEWAEYLAHGNEKGFVDSGVYYKGPLYPWFLSLEYKIFGENYFVFKLIQFILSSLSCVLLYRIGLKLFNSRVAWIAGLGLAAFPLFIFYSGELLIESLFVILLLLAFYVLFCFEERRKSPLHHLWVGILFGFCAITRPNVLIFMPILFFLYLFDLFREYSWGKRAKYCFLLTLGTIIPIVPVSGINYFRGHDLVLISSEAGINFYMGNKEGADGHIAKPDKRYSFNGHFRDSVEYYSWRKMQDETGRTDMKASAVSSYWFGKSKVWIRNNPKEFLSLIFKRMVLYINGYEVSDNKNLYFMAEYSWVLKIGLYLFNFYIWMPIGLMGLIFFIRKWEGRVLLAFFVSYSTTVVFFFVHSRYRVPILPIILLSGGALIDFGISDFPNCRKKWAWTIILIFLIIGCSLDWYGLKKGYNPSQDEWSYGNAYLQRVENQIDKTGKYNPGDLENAQKSFQRALQSFPTSSPDFYILQQVYLDLGKSYYVESKYDKAGEEWERMILEYDRLNGKSMNVDVELLKSAHKNLIIYYRQKIHKTNNAIEKVQYQKKIELHQELMNQIPG